MKILVDNLTKKDLEDNLGGHHLLYNTERLESMAIWHEYAKIVISAGRDYDVKKEGRTCKNLTRFKKDFRGYYLTDLETINKLL